MLVFHGANKPTGRERMWPNEMVLAKPFAAWSGMMERAGTRPSCRSPAICRRRRLHDHALSERRRDSSMAHQIATMVVWPAVADHCREPTDLDNPAVDVIKSIPDVG